MMIGSGTVNPSICVACGSDLEPALARLGSMRCLSCRSEGVQPDRRSGLLRVRLSDPDLADDLESALRLVDCLAERETASTLLVFVPHAEDVDAARREVRVHLAMWRAQRGVRAELVA
jgi:hypothetical protein